MKCNSLLKYIFSGGIILSLSGCFQSGHFIDIGDILKLSITENISPSSEVTISITGILGESAMGIDNIKIKRENDELNILVYARLANSECNGRLDYKLTVPPEISTVTFGKKRVKIWQREYKGT